jgi:Gpi18-like mannosyltransferase
LKTVCAALINALPIKSAQAWNLYGARTSFNWVYLFAAWDSGYYYSLAANWYPSSLAPIWAYFPLYPACIRLLGLLRLDLWLAGFFVSNIAGFLSIIVFQKVGSMYLDESSLLSATLLYFLFPYVFIFTTVSYSDSLFLLLSLATWYAHMKDRELNAAIFGSLTALTRAYGLLILIPLGFDFLKRRQFKRLGFLGLPIAAIAGWLYYGAFKTGNILAPFAAQSYWTSTVAIQIRESVLLLFMDGDMRAFQLLERFWIAAIFGTMCIAFIVWLCIRTWRTDRSLGIYSFTFLLAMILVVSTLVQNFISLPRYLSLVFSNGLSLRTKQRWLLSAVMGLFAILDLVAWWMFLFTENFH